jgi:hypothetical protein
MLTQRSLGNTAVCNQVCNRHLPVRMIADVADRFFEVALHPLGDVVPADGSLGRALDTPLKGIDSTARLVRLLLATPKPPKRRRITTPSRAAVRKRLLENRASKWDPFGLIW